MSESRRQILEMLSQGKITADEAERLMAASERGESNESSSPRKPAKYLRVIVESDEGKNAPTKVNIRVPMQLLRAGVKLASLLPTQARNPINKALHENGFEFDISQIKPENLEELIENMQELSVDVDEEKSKVRIFCE